jgi:hypothetical protein
MPSMNFKYLITSGCSFSDNLEMHWPHYLSKKLNLELYNRAVTSAGNDWISKSVIYQTQQLLDAGVDPKEILVVVMWSGIERQDMFINSEYTFNYKKLLNVRGSEPNPVNFLDNPANTVCRQSTETEDGYLLGSAWAVFKNKNISEFKRNLIKFFTPQALAIASYENFLRVQWFCESKGIVLVNQTYMDIMHFPAVDRKGVETKDYYRNITPLHKMLNFDKWIFWDSTKGLYEYAKENNLGFHNDGEHPLPESHEHYVNNFLIDKIEYATVAERSNATDCKSVKPGVQIPPVAP